MAERTDPKPSTLAGSKRRAGRFLPGNIPARSLVPHVERFAAKIELAPTGCWVWRGARDKDGYGWFSSPLGWVAHRWSYDYFIGPIPPGLQLDHLCRNTSCVNPTHLEPVTGAVNVNRGGPRKVSDAVARQILASRPPGPKRASIGAGAEVVARRFRTSTTTVYRIWRGGVTYV